MLTDSTYRRTAFRALLLACMACALLCACAALACPQQAFAAMTAKQKIVIGNTGLSKLAYSSKKVAIKAKAKTKLTYSSSNKKVATVSKSGYIKLKKAGTVKITVSAKKTKRYRAARKVLKVKVVRAKQKLVASSYNKTLRSAKFKVKVSAKGSPSLTFASNKPAVASVNAKTGKVTVGKVTGVAIITVKAAKTPRYKKATKKVTVRVTRYPFAFEASKAKGTFSLSSLVNSLTMQRMPQIDGLHACDELTPQGVCTYGSYILLTAYCHFHGDVRHNSIIHILDKKTHRAVKTLVLEQVSYGNHVGALTVDDGGNIWVAGSTSQKALLIKRATFEKALAKPESVVEVSYDAKFALSVKSLSFVNYADGELWVGNYEASAKSTLYAYAIESSDSAPTGLTLKRSHAVTPGANGLAIYTTGGIRYFTVARQVSGRLGYSELVFYKETVKGSKRTLAEVGGVSLPCMIEQVHIEGNTLIYAVYESVARYFVKNEDGIGTPVEVTDYGTIGSVSTLLKKALAYGVA